MTKLEGGGGIYAMNHWGNFIFHKQLTVKEANRVKENRGFIFIFFNLFSCRIGIGASNSKFKIHWNYGPSQSGTVVLPGVSTGIYGLVNLKIDFDLGDPSNANNVVGFCVENAAGTSSSFAQYELFSVTGVYKEAAWLYNYYLTGSPSAQATQLAIWNALFDTDSTLYTGPVRVTSTDTANTNYKNEADILLGLLPSDLTNFDASAFRIVHNPINTDLNSNPTPLQDFIIRVPEPGALISLGLVLLGLGGVAVRRFKK